MRQDKEISTHYLNSPTLAQLIKQVAGTTTHQEREMIDPTETEEEEIEVGEDSQGMGIEIGKEVDPEEEEEGDQRGIID
jgi:hypothetical protein